MQLDPVNETYYLTVSLTHEEESGQPFVSDQTDKESGPKPLLHFNGALFAGGDTIIMESITNDPTSGAVYTGTEWKTLTAVGPGYVEGQIIRFHNTFYEAQVPRQEFIGFLLDEDLPNVESDASLVVREHHLHDPACGYKEECLEFSGPLGMVDEP